MTIHTVPLRRRSSAVALSAALAATSFVGVGTGSGTAAAQQAAAPRLVAELEGTDTGDPDGTGYAVVRLFKAKRKVCATITWSKIATPNAAHIHRRSDGGIVVGLSGSVTGGATCARKVPKPTIRKIVEHPRRYYVNVHNEDYPAGAIQGVLHR